MPKPRIFVTRVIPQQGLDMVQALSANYDIEVWQNPLPPAYDVLAEKATGLTGLLCLGLPNGDVPEFELTLVLGLSWQFLCIALDYADRKGAFSVRDVFDITNN